MPNVATVRFIWLLEQSRRLLATSKSICLPRLLSLISAASGRIMGLRYPAMVMAFPAFPLTGRPCHKPISRSILLPRCGRRMGDIRSAMLAEWACEITDDTTNCDRIA